MKCQREKFNLQRKYAYLNCAYMSPLLKKVEKAGIKGMKKKRKPFRITADDFFQDTETLRLLFSQLINNPENQRVCLIPSVSYGMANVTRNLPDSGGNIVVVDEQFPSNVYPWLGLQDKGYEVKFVNAPDSGNRGEGWNEAILESIDSQTQVVAIGHVHWADGTLFDLVSIRKKLDEVGGLLIIDGTQSVGALPFDVQTIRPDALICAGYKWLMGPYSIGLAYYGSQFDNGTPIEENWINRKGAENFGGLINYEPNYQPQALRYEVGEHSNFILLPMMVEALKQLLKWSVPKVQEYCGHLTNYLIAETEVFGYKYEAKEYRAGHLIGLTPPEEIDLDRLQKAFKQKKISVSTRGKSIRVSPNVYNDERDIDRLIKTLKEIKQ